MTTRRVPRPAFRPDVPDLAGLQSAIAGKADAAAVASALQAKANASAVSAALQLKADAAALDGKADTSALAGKADKTAVPQIATSTPMAESKSGDPGNGGKVSDAKHQHPRLASATSTTLGTGGQATVTFTRSFASKPTLVLTEIDAIATAQPLVLRGLAWTIVDGAYTGVTIQGMRAQLLPTLGAVSGLLTAVVTGVNTLVGQLTGFNVFGGSAAGATVSVIALARSDVA